MVERRFMQATDINWSSEKDQLNNFVNKKSIIETFPKYLNVLLVDDIVIKTAGRKGKFFTKTINFHRKNLKKLEIDKFQITEFGRRFDSSIIWKIWQFCQSYMSIKIWQKDERCTYMLTCVHTC